MDESRLALKYKKKIVGFYIMTISILGCWLGLSVLFAFWILSLCDTNGISFGRYIVLAILPIVFSVFAIAVFLTYKPNKPKGYTITPNYAPVLFDLIKDTSKRIDYKGEIDEVLLTPGMSISVYYEPSLKNLFSDSTCKLYIGVGLCRYLSQAELQAVIGHELAHFAQPQTKYKAYLARMANISMALGKKGVVNQNINPVSFGVYAFPARFFCWIFNSMFEQILDVNSAEYIELNHNMELDADRISANVFGADNMLSALCKSVSINARLGIYKNLILPYIASEGYGCGGFWNTFETCSGLFEKIDGLKIMPENALSNSNRTHFDSSELPMPLRLEALMRDATFKPSDSTSEPAFTLFSSSVISMMDRSLDIKYGRLDHTTITETRLNEILNDFQNGIFSGASTIEEAYTIMVDIVESANIDDNVAPQIIMTEYESPSCDVLPQSSVISPTELIFSSGKDKCPVCGHTVGESTKVCPHCHEIISE